MGDAVRRPRRVRAARGRSTSRRSRCSRSPALGLDVGVFYWLGVAVVAGAARCTSTRLVRPDDLRRLDAAFFTVNGVISVVFFAFVLLDVLVD